MVPIHHSHKFTLIVLYGTEASTIQLQLGIRLTKIGEPGNKWLYCEFPTDEHTLKLDSGEDPAVLQSSSVMGSGGGGGGGSVLVMSVGMAPGSYKNTWHAACPHCNFTAVQPHPAVSLDITH